MSAVLATGLAFALAAVAASVVSARFGALCAAAGSTLLGVAGFVCAGGWARAVVGLGDWLGFGQAALRVDRLSGVFLALIGFTAAAVSLALAERPPARLVAGLHGLLLLALAVVVTADQAFVFLLGWETITLSLYLLASADRGRPGALVAAYFNGTMSKLGGGALLAAFALLYARTGSFRLADWAHAAHALGAGTRSAVFVLLLVGLGTKIGLLPLGEPIPLGYAAAPGAAPASLAVALNAGFYGLWRLVLATLAPAPLWWGELLLVLGGLGALVGVLSAIAHDEIKRFLGFSSIEHAGIALIGFGVALIGGAVHEPKLAAAGLLAATLHLVMHAVAKTLAFLAADRLAAATGVEEMAPLGGLARHLPRTAAGFGLAVLSLAAIPPFGGFVSEWFTFEALLQGFRVDNSLGRLLMALAAAMLALTAGLGLLAFAKLFGTTFLGRSRSALGAVREVRGPGAGLTALAATALLLGVAAPWEIRWLGRGLRDVLGFDLATTTISHPLVLGPVYQSFSVLAPTWLAVSIPAFALAGLALVRLLRRRGVRRAPVWLSGSAVAIEDVQYTPAGYSNPIRVVLRGPYGFRRRLRERPARTGEGPALVLETTVVPAFEQLLYRPVTAAMLRLSSAARRLQSGKLAGYLLYMLIVLVVVLALIPVLHH